MKIDTKLIKNMLKMIKTGYKENKFLPLTSMIELKLINNNFSLRITDGRSILQVTESLIDDNFYCVVAYNKFYQLVNKTTTEFIKLNIKDDVVIFKGNGTYKIPIVLDIDGSQLKLNNFINSFYTGNITEFNIELTNPTLLMKRGKQFLADDIKIPESYHNYYINDIAIMGDNMRFMIDNTPPIRSELPILVSQQLLSVLSNLESGMFICLYNSDRNEYLITSGNIIIFFKQINGIELYNREAIINLCNLPNFSEVFTITKEEFSGIINRLRLFVNDKLDGTIYLNNNNNKLEIYNKEKEIVETIDTKFDNNFIIKTELKYLEIIKLSLDSDDLTLYFDGENCIKICENNSTYLVAIDLIKTK